MGPTIISSNEKLSKTLMLLIENYPNVALAVAWASAGTDVFELLRSRRTNIVKAVIGTHFYQTHPDVLKEFVGSDEVRFILQTSGVFHPKVFLFWDDEKWELLVGSANLTAGALTTNAEVMVRLSGKLGGDPDLKSEILSLIEGYWKQAKTVGTVEELSYREIWKIKQDSLKKLSGQYGGRTGSKAPAQTVTMAMSWADYVASVRSDTHHGSDQRLSLLDVIREAFASHAVFGDMSLGLRKTVAGLPTDYNDQWGWFGSMRGAGYYHQAVNENNPHLSDALSQIPMHGRVSRDEYERYVSHFKRAFPNGRDGVAIASRLLAMKRPDQFVCLDAKNKADLCLDFGIKASAVDYDRYWDEIIERITDAPWWNSPRPPDTGEAAIWDGRAAMLDAVFYKP